MESERYQRVMAAIRHEVPDRVPWTLWGHFPCLPFLKYYSWEKASKDGEEVARSHIALLNELDYKMDLLKVTPLYWYMALAWGTRFRFADNSETDEIVDVVVKETRDWEKLCVLDPKKELRESLRAVSILSREIGRTMPFIYPLPSPLTQALYVVSTPERVYADMRSQPDALREGLETISQSCIEFGRACIDEGASGIFYGLAGAGHFWSAMDKGQLEEYGLRYDNRVLHALKDSPIMLLHICSDLQENPQQNGGLMETGWFGEYEANAMNWWDVSFTPASVARKIYGEKFSIVSGLDQERTLRYGTPKQVEDEVKVAIEQAAGQGGFILAPGCTLYQDTPLANFNAVGRAVEKYGRYKR